MTRTTCPEPELLACLVEGSALPEDRARLLLHMAECKDCYGVFAETARFVDTLPASSTVQGSVRRTRNAPLVLPLAAALLLGLGTAALLVRRQAPASPAPVADGVAKASPSPIVSEAVDLPAWLTRAPWNASAWPRLGFARSDSAERNAFALGLHRGALQRACHTPDETLRRGIVLEIARSLARVVGPLREDERHSWLSTATAGQCQFAEPPLAGDAAALFEIGKTLEVLRIAAIEQDPAGLDAGRIGEVRRLIDSLQTAPKPARTLGLALAHPPPSPTPADWEKFESDIVDLIELLRA
jgi:hypothetical protein